jgi:ribosomal protein L32
MIICHGCGREFDAPSGYARTKIRCSECGVYCAVPIGAAEASSDAVHRADRPAHGGATESAAEDQAAALFKDPDVIPWLAEESAPPPKPKAKHEESLIPCPLCGKLLRKNRACPTCHAADENVKSHVLSMALDEPAPRRAALGEEDDPAYAFTDQELPKCPECGLVLPLDSTACSRCGFHLQTRRKAVREFKPVTRSWESDMSLRTRLALLAGAEAVYLLTAAVAAWGGMDLDGLLLFWAVFTALLMFILGTFDRITLTRDRKGRTKLIKRWRAAFVPLPPTTTNVLAFEGITTGQWYNPGILEWFVCLCLVPLGVVPAIVWWYNAIYKPQYRVALAQRHGQTAEYVYRGRSVDQMNDIADTIAKVGGLRRLS